MKLVLFFICFLLASCIQIPTAIDRADVAAKLATKAGWAQRYIATDDFILNAYLPRTPNKSETLTVYIEGDGLAWISSSMPSQDPSPINPLALKLALRDDGAIAYLARPCQYVGIERQRNCSLKYWTSHRFAPEVINSINQAIDQLKANAAAKRLVLVGYSGGGAVAALVTARRNDVEHLVTVAGNLDHQAWTTQHHFNPLAGSLNPADAWQSLQHIPQTHFIGGKDKMVGESIARAFAAHFPIESSPSIIVLSEFNHHCCWEASWPTLKNNLEIHYLSDPMRF